MDRSFAIPTTSPSLQKLGLHGRYQPGFAIQRHVDRLAPYVPFGCLFEVGEGLPSVLRFGSPRHLESIYLQLAFAPGSDVDLEPVLTDGGNELLDGGALSHRKVLVCFPIDCT
jgi:hypothetical protein